MRTWAAQNAIGPLKACALTHWHFDTFEVQWRKRLPWFGKGKVQFHLDEQGKVTEMKVTVPNDDFWFTELEFKKK